MPIPMVTGRIAWARRGQARHPGIVGRSAYGMSRETFSGTEVSYEQIGENDIKLPHLYSCSQQLRLLRMMLLREQRDTLWIGQAIPRDWLKTRPASRRPRRCNRIRRCRFSDQRGRRRYEKCLWIPPTRKPPSKILLRLRDPRQRNIASVTVNRVPHSAFAGETIELKGLDGPADIRVTFVDPK